MSELPVVGLIYQVSHNGSVDYGAADSLCMNENEFQLVVKDRQARFELKKPYPTEADAKGAVKNYICRWVFDACLDHGPDYFQLEYRGPITADPGMMHALPARAVDSASTPRFRAPAYPSPPSGISLTPNVKTMYQRYMGYLRGCEPLASMAYFCLTKLDDLPEQKAAKKYNISARLCTNSTGISAYNRPLASSPGDRPEGLLSTRCRALMLKNTRLPTDIAARLPKHR